MSTATVYDLVREFGESTALGILTKYVEVARRDAAICAALDAGQPYAWVASRYRLSVRQIIRIGKHTHR